MTRMEGLLVEVLDDESYDLVDTRNDQYGVLRLYYNGKRPQNLVADTTVEFDIRRSKSGHDYAVFTMAPERNAVQFNTEDRDKWYEWGENAEADFIEKIVPEIGYDIRRNPEKDSSPWAIDLFDYTNNRYADLKTQCTPFFTAAKYTYKGRPCNPEYTVTFNCKDCENYSENYSDCDIYFWVHWKNRIFGDITIPEVHGLWRASYTAMKRCIDTGEVPIHVYKHRVNDDHNAQESYLFSLIDTATFVQLL